MPSQIKKNRSDERQHLAIVFIVVLIVSISLALATRSDLSSGRNFQAQLAPPTFCEFHKEFWSDCSETPGCTAVDQENKVVVGGGSGVFYAWDQHNTWGADIKNAHWIWDGFFVNNPRIDVSITIGHDFDLPTDATNISANLKVAADKYYYVTINDSVEDIKSETGTNVGIPAKEYDVGSLVLPGHNIFRVRGKNIGAVLNTRENPAGILYRMDIDYSSSCTNCALGDTDTDSVCGERDNCPSVANTDQADKDDDGKGDACDPLCAVDVDQDGVCDDSDNCVAYANPRQEDTDGNGAGDMCQVCTGQAFRQDMYHIPTVGRDGPMPDFDTMEPYKYCTVSQIYIGDGSTPPFPCVDPLPAQQDHIGVSWSGFIYAPEMSDHNYVLISRDESSLSIDNREILYVDGPSSINYESQGVDDMNPGLHFLRVDYYSDFSNGSVVLHDINLTPGSGLTPTQAALPTTPGLCQCSDKDSDTICDAIDNCSLTANLNQADTDGDGIGDVCDTTIDSPPCTDSDGDGKCDTVDNCPSVSNTSQANADTDSLGDACDNCSLVSNTTQTNSDTDTLGDACDTCPLDALNDADADGKCANLDNCPTIANPNQADADTDGIGDVCDSSLACTPIDCVDPNTFPTDTNSDGCTDTCRPVVSDTDGDGIANTADNCPSVSNTTQTNSDTDSLGNACDNCPAATNQNQSDTDTDGIGDACDTATPPPCTDSDGDGKCNTVDNCPNVSNANQANTDGDTLGNVCDVCPLDALNDIDTDGKCGNVDNCPTIANPSQADADGDNIGDVCEAATATSAIFGKVVDAQTAQPVAGATVTATGPAGSTTTTTDANGDYSITGIPNGNYVVTIARANYATETKNTVITNYSRNELNAAQTATTAVTADFRLRVLLEGRDSNLTSSRGGHNELSTIRIYNSATKALVSQQTRMTDIEGWVVTPLDKAGLIEGQSYDIVVNVDKYVSMALRNSVYRNPPNALTIGPLFVGDIAGVSSTWPGQGDCTINNADISELFRFWGKANGPHTDVDRNGMPGAEDYSTLHRNMGRSCATP